MLRTNTCGELDKPDVNKKVRLAGWCQSRRDHGGLIFIDLRDRYGLTQIVFDPKLKQDFKTAEKLRREDVIVIEGKVVARKKGMENLKLKTGKIEIDVDKVKVLNKSATPPIEIGDRVEAGEDARSKYRYLDLRRPVMQKRLLIRHLAAQATREFLNSQGFLEIETPLLVRSTPEGARDYLVPSRVNLGKFYSLPQSPQLYKQILMVAGIDRYYQLAKCLRDEDLRQDRQPEFTQIDIEMSFIDQEDIYKLSEGVIKNIFKKAIGVDIKIPFSRMSYEQAIKKYGTDKPDLRISGLELADVSDIVNNSDFKVFKDIIAKKGVVKCVNAKKAKFSRKELEELIDFMQALGAPGLAWMKIEKGKLESNIVKYFDKKVQDELIKKMKAKEEDFLFFVGDKEDMANELLNKLRDELAKRLKLIKQGFAFCWITDFPLFEWDEDANALTPMHHIFTSPKDEDIKYLDKEPEKVKGKMYDLVLNGVELGGGSIRIHQKELQEKVFNVIGLKPKQAEQKFGFLLEAFKYGAPPHGGIAFGFDRLCALLCGINDIREVIAFPKNKAAQSLMDSCPNEISAEQLKELGISAIKKK